MSAGFFVRCDRKELLRRAREAAPAVLPRAISQAVVLALGDAFYDQREYQNLLVGEILALDAPSQVDLSSVELTSEEVVELKAKFEALKHGMPEVLYRITRANLSYVLMDAYGLGMDDAEAGAEARSHEGLHRAMARDDEKSAQILLSVGIPVQEGNGS